MAAPTPNPVGVTGEIRQGLCHNCRIDFHAHCVEPECRCANGAHPRRPAASGKRLLARPPRRGRPPTPVLLEAQVAALRAHPKRWAKVKDFPDRKAAARNAGARLRKLHPGLETRSAVTERGSVLYARWVGP